MNQANPKWWWLAINGPSLSASAIPLSPDRVQVRPVPEQLIGFKTQEEQLAAQDRLLHDPIERVEECMATMPQRIRAGEVNHIRPVSPEPPTKGPIVWVPGRD